MFKKRVYHSADEIINQMAKKRHQAVEEACTIVEADAKLLSPVKTGRLKRSLTHAVESDKKQTRGSVGTNVEYAYYAERSSPYLEPAVDKNKQQIINKMKDVLK